MAFESNIATVIGNLTDDPDLRYTNGGTPVVTIRVASNRKFTKADGTESEETFYVNANLWRDAAENAAESFSKGDRAVIIGRLRTRSYENKDGQTVWTTEIEADEVAGSTRFARLQVTRQGNGGGNKPPTAAAAAAAADGNSQDTGDIPF